MDKGLFGPRTVANSLADRADLSNASSFLLKFKDRGIGAGTQGLIDLIPTVVPGSFAADMRSNVLRPDLVFGHDMADFEAMGGVMAIETLDNSDVADGYVFVRSNGPVDGIIGLP